MNTPETQSGGSLEPVGSETYDHDEVRCDEMADWDCENKLPGVPRTCCVCAGHDCAEARAERAKHPKRISPNVAAHRPGARDSRLGARGLSPGSVQPLCWTVSSRSCVRSRVLLIGVTSHGKNHYPTVYCFHVFSVTNKAHFPGIVIGVVVVVNGGKPT